MLVLSRKLNEAIVIDGDIRITIVGIRGNQVRLGIEAPERVRIFREELCAGTGTEDRDEARRWMPPPRSEVGPGQEGQASASRGETALAGWCGI